MLEFDEDGDLLIENFIHRSTVRTPHDKVIDFAITHHIALYGDGGHLRRAISALVRPRLEVALKPRWIGRHCTFQRLATIAELLDKFHLVDAAEEAENLLFAVIANSGAANGRVAGEADADPTGPTSLELGWNG